MAQHELARFETISSSFLVDFLATRGAGLGLFLFFVNFYYYFFFLNWLLAQDSSRRLHWARLD